MFRFEIDRTLDVASFFKDKFIGDQIKQKQFCNNLYRNHVRR